MKSILKLFNLFIKIISISVIFNTILLAQAPDTLWTKTFGGSGLYVGNSVQQTTDGGYIIAGGNGDVLLLIKTDASGDTLWTKTSDRGEGNSVQQTTDGGYIVAGTKKYDLWLIKTDALGDTLWTKTFGRGAGKSVQQTADGGYIVAGGSDHWLIKTDASGDTLWTKTFGEGEGNSVQQTTDGGYIVAGEKNDDLWLIKTDASGDTLWTKTFDRGDSERGHSVQQTADGGYIVTGYASIDYSAGMLVLVWLIKTDASGDSLWTKTVDEDWWEMTLPGGEGRPHRSSVQQTNDGGYIVAGGLDELLIKTDASGDTLWTWTKTMIFDVTDRSVQQTADGGYIVAGTNVAGTDDWEVFLIKIAPDLTNIQKKETKLVTHYSLSQNYPNPFNPITNIEFQIPNSGFTTLKVYNILGEEMATLVSAKLNPGNHTYTFNGKNLASGVYYYQLVAGEYREVKKMILLR